MTRQFRIAIILAAALAGVVGVFFLPPIAQDQAYHNFADSRAWLGIPNFGDVVGNAPFVVMGVLGLYTVSRERQNYERAEYRAWKAFFLGIFLTGFGSAYYHWAPDNHTLVWDRLPMTIAFMSLTSLIIMERIDARIGARLFPLFMLAGVFSVEYWRYTESLGQGDLRPYALVQFLPMIVLALVLALFPRPDRRTSWLFYTFGFYVLAKLLEHFDRQVYEALGHAVSGHTLKHLAAAAGTWWMIKYAKRAA